MKNKKIKIAVIIILLLAIITCSILLFLPKNNKVVNTNNKNEFATLGNIASQIYLGEDNTPVFIDNYNFTVKNKDDIKDLLEDLKEMYGFTNPSNEFEIINEEEVDKVKFYKLQQLYSGVPVYGYQLVVSTEDNKVSSISGNYKKDISLFNTYSKLTDEEIKEILGSNDVKIINSERIIYIYENNPILSYKTNYCTYDKCNTAFIDIKDKKIYKEIDYLHNLEDVTYTGKDALGKEVTIDMKYEKLLGNTNYYFENPKYGFRVIDASNIEMDIGTETLGRFANGIKFLLSVNENNKTMEAKYTDGKLFYIPQNLSTPSTILEDAVSAMNNLQKIYDYYYNVLGRNSVDGKGKKIRIYIDAIGDSQFLSAPVQYENACWMGDDNIIVIGRYKDKSLAVSLDVLAHEFTHGVVQYTAGLGGENEPGALNESYADIMGSLIEGENFTMCESIEIFRSLEDPSLYKDPSIYGEEYFFPTDTNYYNTEWQTATLKRAEENKRPLNDWKKADNGGVHTNCGVPNHAAYLAYANGAFKNKEEMAKVYYKSLFYLTTNSKFKDSAIAVLKAARVEGLADDKIEIIREAYIKTKILPSVPIKITGKVVDEDNKPLEGVEVKAAYKSNLNAFYITHTDKNGNYSFNELPKEEYVLFYEKAKYEVNETNVSLEEDKTVDDIVLKLIEKETINKKEVVFVMDISASMDDTDPNDIRKQMISNVISELDNDTYYALVIFNKIGTVYNDGINRRNNDKTIITDIFNIINDDGQSLYSGTNGKAGLTRALNLFSNNESRKYIIFFTDGEDNMTNADDLSYSEIEKQAKEKGIRIISIGLGSELSKSVLESLAKTTNGKYFNATSFNRLSTYTKKIYDEIK